MKKQLILFLLFIVSIQLNAQNETYEVFNTSINSKNADFGLSYYNESTVVYASSKKTENDKSFAKDRRKNNRQFFIDLYLGTINNNDITNEQKFTTEVNTKYFMSDVSFTSDQKTVYFTWNNFYNSTSRKDSAKWKTLYIVKASINANLELSEIEKLPFNSDDYSIRNPEISKDGGQLFFTSDMPGGFGESDIYVVDVHNDGTYSEPRNLGSNVNTKHAEMFPHAAKNGHLYFSTVGHNKNKGYDIFKSEFINGRYEKSIELPFPINTPYDDFAFVINEENNTGFITSTRKKGKGDADIYSFVRIPPELICSKEISGNILNINSREPLSNVKIQLISNFEIIQESITDNNGDFSFDLDCDVEYKLAFSKINYVNSELIFKTDSDFKDKKSEEILLTPNECLQTLKLDIVQQDTNEILNNVALKFLKNNEEFVPIDLSDLNAIPLDCNGKYQLIAEKTGYIAKTISFNTTNEYNDILVQKIILEPIKCYQNFTGTIVDKSTQKELTDLKVKLISKGVTIDEINLDSYKLNFTLDCDKTYKIKVEKQHYKSEEFEISTSNEIKKVLFKTIELEPLECSQTVNITVVDSFEEPISGALIQLYKNDAILETIESNAKKSTLKFDCENTYKITVSKENYISQEYNFTTSRQYDLGLTKQFELIKRDCNQIISGIVTNAVNKEKLTNAKLSLLSNDNLIRSIFTNDSASFSFDLNCNNEYKIIVEQVGFNTETFELKTDSEFNKTKSKNFVLYPAVCKQPIVLTAINSTSKEVLSDVSFSLFDGTNLVETKVSIDDINFDLICKKQYKIKASKEHYFSKEIVISTNDEHNKILKETIELIEKECVQPLSGVITNSENNSKLSNVKVSLMNDNELLNSTFTNEDGEYNLQLNCESNYNIIVEKNEFETESFELNTNGEFNKLQTKNFVLTSSECNQVVTVTALNSISKEELSEVRFSLYNNSSLIKTENSSGAINFELNCKEQYRIVVSKEHYFSKEIVINTNDEHKKDLKETIELIEKDCVQPLSGVVTNSNNNSKLSNVKVSLMKNDELVNSIFTNEKGEYKFQLNCNTNYSVQFEKNEFETESFELKLNKDFDVDIFKNINLNPIPCHQIVSGSILNDINGEGISNAIVKLFNNEKIIFSTQTDAKGIYEFNVECLQTYKIIALHENFSSSEISFTTEKLENETVRKDIELSPKKCTQTLNIVIADENTNVQLQNLNLEFIKNNLTIESISLKTKTLIFDIDCNSTYKLKISKEFYEDKEVEINSNSDFFKKFTEIIKLKPLPCKQYISGTVIDKKQGNPIENSTIEVYSNNSLVSSFKTTENGNYNIELDCNKNYNIVTVKNNYLNDLKIINTTNQYDKEFKVDIYLNNDEAELFEEVENVRTVKMNPINFALNESKITTIIAQELDKLIKTLNKYPKLKLEIKNHTDSRAPDDYNLGLSEDRASSLVNYIITNGIDSSRVSGKGYGETKLLNKCSNGVKCSESEHQENRRTEFIVIEK